VLLTHTQSALVALARDVRGSRPASDRGTMRQLVRGTRTLKVLVRRLLRTTASLAR